MQNLLDCPVLVGIRKWGLSHVQLVDEDTKGPGIGRFVVPFAKHELRREVLGSPAQRVRLVVEFFVLLERDALRKATFVRSRFE